MQARVRVRPRSRVPRLKPRSTKSTKYTKKGKRLHLPRVFFRHYFPPFDLNSNPLHREKALGILNVSVGRRGNSKDSFSFRAGQKVRRRTRTILVFFSPLSWKCT
ncbi:hypothetical protein TNCV_1626151 [Trichonephila clavipes]|nr:hypothetical protein TNCV_1626151 [Trichonephila clavipes]